MGEEGTDRSPAESSLASEGVKNRNAGPGPGELVSGEDGITCPMQQRESAARGE